MSTLKALQAYSSALGSGHCPAGTFRYDMRSGGLQWSEEIYLIHGYQRGEVVPTLGLLISHQHPEDRNRCRENLEEVSRVGGFLASYHRLIDARGREHRVLTAGVAAPDEDGGPLVLDGFLIDLTTTVQSETDRAAREAIAGAMGTRALIEQAKGILMGIHRIGSETAFDRLSAYSQQHNIKIARTAAAIVRLANDTHEPAAFHRLIHALDGVFAEQQDGANRARDP